MRKILILSILLLFIGSIFYWFQWRPSEIRKECSEKANNKAHDFLLTEEILTTNQSDKQYYIDAYNKGLLNVNARDNYYTSCLHGEGL